MPYRVNGQRVKKFEQTPIALSPPVVGAGNWQFTPVKGVAIEWQSKYVGMQYLDNTGSSQRMTEPYLLNDLQLSYTATDWPLIAEMTARFKVNNFLDVQYASSGYTYSFVRQDGEIAHQNYYYLQAGRHYMGTLSFKF